MLNNLSSAPYPALTASQRAQSSFLQFPTANLDHSAFKPSRTEGRTGSSAVQFSMYREGSYTAIDSACHSYKHPRRFLQSLHETS